MHYQQESFMDLARADYHINDKQTKEYAYSQQMHAYQHNHMILFFITYLINIFPDTVHFSQCDTGISSDDTGEEREK